MKEEQNLLVATKPSEEKGGLTGPGYGAVSDKESLEEHTLFLFDGSRLPCLDIARIVCVGLVVVNHGGSSWSDQFGLWNQMYVQQWVLQWLFVICGMSFGMSSRNTWGYLSRLGLYFVIGVVINWSAWVMKGLDWKSNFWNVIFQFWFIFGLMMYIIMLTPVKRYLSNLRTRTDVQRDLGLVAGLGIMLGLLVAVHLSFTYVLVPLTSATLGRALVDFKKDAGSGGAFWGLPDDMHQSTLFIAELLGYVQVSVGSLLILWIFPKMSNRLSLTAWLVLLHVFCCRCIFYRGQFARIVDGFDFTMIGLVNFYLGLAYRRTIGKYMCRYWFVVLFLFACLIPPGTFGRFDESTITNLPFRIKFHLVEFALILLFLCAAERIADGAIFAEDKLGWLSWWALYLFLFHKAIHILVPHPFNWAVICLIAPVAWYFHGDTKSATIEKDAQPEGEPSPSEVADVERAAEGVAESPPKITGSPRNLLNSQLQGR